VTAGGRRLLVVAGGTRATASTRHRLWNYRPYLERDGVELEWVEYTGGRLESMRAALAARLRFLWDLGRHASVRDVVLVQKVLPPIPLVERWRGAGARVVYDFDDALFERFEWGETEAKAAQRRRRFDGMLRAATHVLAGSPPLADYARGLNPSVDVFYPSLERERFEALPRRAPGPARVIGWVGTDQSQIYLQQLEPVLADVLAAHPDAVLRVCSSSLPPLRSLPADRVELVRWSQAAELEALASFDVAISPLSTDPWSQARGGRVSVLVSLAAGVPVVASPGGGLEELAADAGQSEPGVLVARDGAEWRAHLSRLLADESERQRRSAAARALIDRSIWADAQYPRLRRALLGS
jgi:glycosyltransferase involved in cell wall biosynthesis